MAIQGMAKKKAREWQDYHLSWRQDYIKMRFLLTMTLVAFLFSPVSEAKRRKKSKLVVPANQIMRLEGKATVNGEPAMEFMGLKNGDEVETAPESVAVLRVSGLGLFRLKENTKFKLKQIKLK